MNILIVGNGFDLSHYLPTKYDHFMDVMRAIESKDTGGLPLNFADKDLEEWLKSLNSIFEKREELNQPLYEMKFEELFSKCRDSKFIAKTREYYDVQNILIRPKVVIEIQYRLAKNSWYQYFKDHVQEIKTWIDFEQKIEEVIYVFNHVANELSDIKNIDSNKSSRYLDTRDVENEIRITQKNIKILSFFKFITDEPYKKRSYQVGIQGTSAVRKNLNKIFCHGESISNGFNPVLFLDFLYLQLEEFIKIFDLYLDLIVSQLASKALVDIRSENWVSPDKIFSFNYTNTYQRIHDSLPVEYLHGSHGEFQNIVLGISDLEDERLIKLKAFGFTKYHQKLFKDTDYLFLDKYKRAIQESKRKFDDDLKLMSANALSDIRAKFIQRGFSNSTISLDLNFIIWGHSLDVSDQDYIKDLFSLNDDLDRNVRVTVYYFDKSAKFSLLNNLLAILGKDKVEQWMKNGWLKFEKNPEINFGL